MTQSSVPGALAALVTTLQTALPALDVVLGQDYDPGKDYLTVGWVSDDEPGITALLDTADAGWSRDKENYDVHCLLGVHRGNRDKQEVLVLAYGYLNTAIAALRSDFTLAGAVTRARFSEHSGLILKTEKGRLVAIRLVITIESWK